MPSKTERYFSSGNERSPFRFDAGGNTGYYLGDTDMISWVVDLMNMYVSRVGGEGGEEVDGPEI